MVGFAYLDILVVHRSRPRLDVMYYSCRERERISLNPNPNPNRNALQEIDETHLCMSARRLLCCTTGMVDLTGSVAVLRFEAAQMIYHMMLPLPYLMLSARAAAGTP